MNSNKEHSLNGFSFELSKYSLHFAKIVSDRISKNLIKLDETVYKQDLQIDYINHYKCNQFESQFNFIK